MHLPAHVNICMQALEAASFPTYAVGGCVRDWLLGLQPHDYDLCTAATPDEIQAALPGHELLLHGVKHGTVGVVIDSEVVEITTFRTEGTYTDNRHPDWVEFVTDIKSDLARRDFTVNAMAWSPKTGLYDPFGGEKDLKNKVLKAVGDPDLRFQEDALRILRGIRFAARFGLSVEENTWQAMLRQLPLTDHLAAERVFSELCQLLLCVDSSHLLRYAPILTHLIPELAPTVGFDQHSPHHAYDVYTHTAYVTAATPAALAQRWAALLHDTGKVPTFTQDENGRGHFYGHAAQSAAIADAVLRRLKAPTVLRNYTVWLIENHMLELSPDPKLLRRRISHSSCEAVLALIDLQEADMGAKGIPEENDPAFFAQLREAVRKIQAENACLRLRDLAIDGNDLIAAGYTPGKKFSTCLQYLLEQVLSENIPNKRDALMAAAHAYLSQMPEDVQ